MLDKEKIRRNFSRSASEYDQHAVLQKELADELFLRLCSVLRPPRSVLDVGCGAGYLTKRLAEKFPDARVVGIDLALGMIKTASGGENLKNLSFQLADGESLPFDNDFFDLVVSNASLQWMRPEKALPEAARVVRPGGKFFFSTFGPATLSEIKKQGLAVNDFPAQTELTAVLGRFFQQHEMNSVMAKQEYKDIFDLFAHLKALGAQTSSAGKNTGLMTKNKMAALFPVGVIKATYEIFYGEATV